VAAFDFSHSIIEHNLQKENDELFNFLNVADIVQLDPEVADEIDKLISKLNDLNKTAKEKDEKVAPLAKTSVKPLSQEKEAIPPTLD
jgi:hypothetical protein